MSLSGKSIRSYVIIVIGNLIPAIGIVAFNWSMTEAFMFYAAELCAYELVMLPKIVIHVFTTGENFLDSVFKKIIKSFAWLIYHLMMFGFAIMFLVHSAYAISASSAFVTWQEIIIFAEDNYLIILFIVFEYMYVFFSEFVKMKEYDVLPSRHYDIEIGVFYLLLISLIGIIHGLSVMIQLDSDVYQWVMLVIIIGFKTIAQLLLKKRKDKLYLKFKNLS